MTAETTDDTRSQEQIEIDILHVQVKELKANVQYLLLTLAHELPHITNKLNLKCEELNTIFNDAVQNKPKPVRNS